MSAVPGAGGGGGDRRVVVAHSEEGVRSFVGMTLGQGSWDVAAAADTEAAIEQIVRRIPDVLLIDADLPGGGGPALTSSLRAQPETEGIHVVLLIDRTEARQRTGPATERGADAVLTVPFTALALLAKVRRLAVAAG